MSKQRRHLFLVLRKTERTHIFHNEFKLSLFGGDLAQLETRARFQTIEIDKNPSCPIWPINLLDWCTATQSPLAHRIFQGVEYTSPTGWSNPHLSIEDKYVLAVWQTAYFSGQLVQLLQMIIQSLI